MALKDIWKNKVNGVDDVVAEDINAIAQSAIGCEEGIKTASDKTAKLEKDMAEMNDKVDGIQRGFSDKIGDIDTALNAIPETYATKADVSEQIGDIDTALDGIIAIQNSLIGGDE